MTGYGISNSSKRYFIDLLEGGRSKTKDDSNLNGRSSFKQSCCSHFYTFALAAVNLFFMLFVGAGLSTASRLKWDPTIYLTVRGLMPLEYKVLSGLLVAGSSTMIVLALFAIFVLLSLSGRLRRVSLWLYGLLLSVHACAVSATSGWLLLRIHYWLQSDQALMILNVLRMRKPLVSMLEFFGRFIQIPRDISRYIKEAEEDVPYNLYIGMGVIATYALLHVFALILVVLLARGPEVIRLVPSKVIVSRKQMPIPHESKQEGRH